MAEVRRRKTDDESKSNENLIEQAAAAVAAGGGGGGSGDGAGTDDDSSRKHKRKTSGGLSTADSSDHVNIYFIHSFRFQRIRNKLCNRNKSNDDNDIFQTRASSRYIINEMRNAA